MPVYSAWMVWPYTYQSQSGGGAIPVVDPLHPSPAKGSSSQAKDHVWDSADLTLAAQALQNNTGSGDLNAGEPFYHYNSDWVWQAQIGMSFRDGIPGTSSFSRFAYLAGTVTRIMVSLHPTMYGDLVAPYAGVQPVWEPPPPDLTAPEVPLLDGVFPIGYEWEGLADPTELTSGWYANSEYTVINSIGADTGEIPAVVMESALTLQTVTLDGVLPATNETLNMGTTYVDTVTELGDLMYLTAPVAGGSLYRTSEDLGESGLDLTAAFPTSWVDASVAVSSFIRGVSVSRSMTYREFKAGWIYGLPLTWTLQFPRIRFLYPDPVGVVTRRPHARIFPRDDNRGPSPRIFPPPSSRQTPGRLTGYQ